MYKGIAADQDFEFYCDFKPTLFFVNLKKKLHFLWHNVESFEKNITFS